MKTWLGLIVGLGAIALVGCGGAGGTGGFHDGFSAASTSIEFRKGFISEQADGSYLITVNVKGNSFLGSAASGDEIAPSQFEAEFARYFGHKPALVGIHVVDDGVETTRLFHLYDPDVSVDGSLLTFKGEPHVAPAHGPLSHSNVIAPTSESNVFGKIELDTDIPENVYAINYSIDGGNNPHGLISFDSPTTFTFNDPPERPYNPVTTSGAAAGAFATLQRNLSTANVSVDGRINGVWVEHIIQLNADNPTESFEIPSP